MSLGESRVHGAAVDVDMNYQYRLKQKYKTVGPYFLCLSYQTQTWICAWIPLLTIGDSSRS